MKNKKLVLIIVILVLLFIGAGAIYKQFGQEVKTSTTRVSKNDTKQDAEKKKAPDFKVIKQDGKVINLHAFIGKPIVINFWSSKCPPCRKEMPDFNEVYKEYKDKVNFVMVDSIGALGETKDAGTAFVKDNGFSFPIYYDEDHSAQGTYGVYAYPTTYLLDKDGILSKKQNGGIPKEVLSKALDEELSK